MQFRFIQIPVVVFLFFCTLQPAISQNSTDWEEVINILDEKYGIDQQLYRGIKYFPKVNVLTGHAWLFDPDFIKSSIKYQQKIYHQVLIKYDIELDQLIIKTPIKYGAELQLVLDEEYVNEFWLGDKYFVRNTTDEIPQRYLQIIADDNIVCMATHTKEFKFMKGGRNEGYGFTQRKAKYYVKINNTITQVKSKRSLIKQLPQAHIAHVKQYLDKHKFKVGKMTDTQWTQLFSFINELYYE